MCVEESNRPCRDGVEELRPVRRDDERNMLEQKVWVIVAVHAALRLHPRLLLLLLPLCRCGRSSLRGRLEAGTDIPNVRLLVYDPQPLVLD